MDKKDSYENMPDSYIKIVENNNIIQESVAPIVEHTNRMQQIINNSVSPQNDITSSAIKYIESITENSSMMILKENVSVINNIYEKNRGMAMSVVTDKAIETLHSCSMSHTLGEMAIKSVIKDYQFKSSVLREVEELGKKIAIKLANRLTALMTNPIIQEIQSITSRLGKWLQTVDFSPLTNILESIPDIEFDYDKVNDIFLKAMFDARWFPYAGWIDDFKIADAMFEILNSSRVSKNRAKRIDKLIFSYYDKNRINNFKRTWRQMNLPMYMTRILVQSVQAYHRREYALTVSALSTLWEGIIQEKMNDDSYRISKRTRENLAKLIEENDFNKIISSFCNEFIFYDCNKPEEVKSDVPGRHSIAHCWYDAYPNRKMALNAILFTDFLLGLKCITK